jgi:hypothetical protein
VIGLYAVTMGAPLCLAPERFVSVFRSVIGDKAARTAEWQEALESPSGRLLGALVFVFGGWLFWMLYFHRH